jgi:hypothetical protein
MEQDSYAHLCGFYEYGLIIGDHVVVYATFSLIVTSLSIMYLFGFDVLYTIIQYVLFVFVQLIFAFHF